MTRRSLLVVVWVSAVWASVLGAEEPAAKLRKTIASDYKFMLDIAYSPQGDLFATTGKVGRRWGLVLRSAETGDVVHFRETGDSPLHSVAFSPDGALVAVAGGYDAAAVIWNSATGEEQRRLPLADDDGAAGRVAFRPDGKTLATGVSQNGRIAFWNVSTGKSEGVIGGGSHFAFSPDGRWIANGRQSPTIHLHDAASLAESNPPIESDMRVAVCLAFIDDSQTLAVGGNAEDESDCAIKLWDVAKREPCGELPGPTSPTIDLALTADGRTLASLSADGQVWLWDAHSRKHLATIEEHGARAIAFSPDHPTLATCSTDEIQWWDVSTLVGKMK